MARKLYYVRGMTNTSRYATTSYNRGKRVESAIRDIYSRAVAFHFTADRITELMSAVWQSADARKLTGYQLGYVWGIADMLREDIWRNHVAWMLGPSSGPSRQVPSEWTEEMSRLCRLPGQLYGGHFWTDDNGQGTDKVFTEYKPTN